MFSGDDHGYIQEVDNERLMGGQDGSWNVAPT